MRYVELAWTQLLGSVLKHVTNAKFIQGALSRPLCPARHHQPTHGNHFHWICMDPYQMPLISLLHGAIFLASQMLSLLNQPAPKMYCQPLPPYTPTMATQKCTKQTMGHPLIARSSEIFPLHEGSTLSTLTLITLKGTRQNAL